MRKFHFTLFTIFAALLFGVPALAQSRGNAAGTPASASSARFCITYWSYGQEPAEEIYYKESPNARSYKFMKIGVMCFFKEFEYRGKFPMPIFRKATPAEIEQRKKEGGAKSHDLEYTKIAEIHSNGLTHFGVVLLPMKENFSKESQLIFNLDEKAFPPGTYRIYNASKRVIGLKIKPESAAGFTNFTVRPAQAILSPKSTKESERFDFEAYAQIKNDDGATTLRMIWKTLGFLKNDERVCVFLAEDVKRSQETGRLKMTTRSVPIPNFAPAENATDDGGNAQKNDEPRRRGEAKRNARDR